MASNWSRADFDHGPNGKTCGTALIESYRQIVFSSTSRRARCRLRLTSSLGLTVRPLRGRYVTAGGSAGLAGARCTRPRATHGYFIDRSAVGTGRCGPVSMATASKPSRSTPLLAPDRNLCATAPGSDPMAGVELIGGEVRRLATAAQQDQYRYHKRPASLPTASRSTTATLDIGTLRSG